MDQKRYVSFPGRPLSYSELLLQQLQRVADGMAGEVPPQATIRNVEVMDIFTIIDQDEEYKQELAALDDIRQKRINRCIDIDTGEQRSDIIGEINFEMSLEKLRAIMRCLERRRRFPARFTKEYDQEIIGDAGGEEFEE